ncbi:multiple epidermal growth factor-like domains protein 6 isoform X2 [Patella vulgata]|uniref:multiple epidermal growth factor-like domains protein 6 isoform X2 n=1 Tax=Patella vulgata TaxID=6465 RepID=UPI0024A7E4B7|nr:multiple epidermal growth factor-like domains protein 6 isoform X2 [Patella vulgata]
MCYKMITADKCLMFSVLLSQVTSIFGAVNVANNKPTRQSTINLGVNTSSWAGLTAWWCIDLRQEFHINTVKISKPIHDGRNILLDGFEMGISSSGQCDKAGFTAATPCFKNRTSTTDSVYTIERCNHPTMPSLSARYIFISVKRTDARLDICEVQVFADNCPDGFYGSNCNIRCPTSCLNNTCDKVGGSCSHGCHGDHYGKKCQSTCSSHCKDGKCDDRTGRCFGCEDGYYGDACEESCFTCNGTCRQLDGVCLTGCKDGYWGCSDLCLQTCSYCKPGGCRIEDGVCNNGCKDGLSNTKCYQNAGCAGCGPLPHKLNAFVENSQAMHPVGANRNYTCIKGAYVKGSPFAHCLPSGEWDIQSFTCKIGHGAKRTYVHGYETIRSYNGSINYNIDLQQVINIVDASAECEQFIKFECFHVETFSSVGLSTRTGQLATYLMGGVKGQMGCACHISKTCVDGLKCNCDKNDDRLRVDEGYIRYKEDLPITAVLVGDTGNDKEYAYYTVGNLRCKG